MTPYQKDIDVRFGDRKEIFFRIRERVFDGENWGPGNYRDLTGYTVLSQIRSNADSEDIILQFSVTVGDQTDEVNGRGSILLKLTGSQTETVSRMLTNAVWDCQLTDPDGNVDTYIGGKVNFNKDVSRPGGTP